MIGVQDRETPPARSFQMVMEDVLEHVTQHYASERSGIAPFQTNERERMDILTYADDCTIVAKSKADAQRMMALFEHFLHQVGLQL